MESQSPPRHLVAVKKTVKKKQAASTVNQFVVLKDVDESAAPAAIAEQVHVHSFHSCLSLTVLRLR